MRLQQAYENNEVKEEDMSYDQILTLNRLYKKQIKKIDEDLNVKKININLLQKKMANEVLSFLFIFDENLDKKTKK